MAETLFRCGPGTLKALPRVLPPISENPAVPCRRCRGTTWERLYLDGDDYITGLRCVRCGRTRRGWR